MSRLNAFTVAFFVLVINCLSSMASYIAPLRQLLNESCTTVLTRSRDAKIMEVSEYMYSYTVTPIWHMPSQTRWNLLVGWEV